MDATAVAADHRGQQQRAQLAVGGGVPGAGNIHAQPQRTAQQYRPLDGPGGQQVDKTRQHSQRRKLPWLDYVNDNLAEDQCKDGSLSGKSTVTPSDPGLPEEGGHTGRDY